MFTINVKLLVVFTVSRVSDSEAFLIRFKFNTRSGAASHEGGDRVPFWLGPFHFIREVTPAI